MTDVSVVKSELGGIVLLNMTNGESVVNADVGINDSISMTDSILVEIKGETKNSDIMTDGLGFETEVGSSIMVTLTIDALVVEDAVGTGTAVKLSDDSSVVEIE